MISAVKLFNLDTGCLYILRQEYLGLNKYIKDSNLLDRLYLIEAELVHRKVSSIDGVKKYNFDLVSKMITIEFELGIIKEFKLTDIIDDKSIN